MTETIPTVNRPRAHRRWPIIVLALTLIIFAVVALVVWRVTFLRDMYKQIVGASATSQAFSSIDPSDCSSLDRYECVHALNCKPDIKKSPSCSTGFCTADIKPGPSYLGCIALTDVELQQRSVDQTACEQIPGKTWHYGVGNYDLDGRIPSRSESCSCVYLVDETLFNDGPMIQPYTTVSLGTQVNKVYADGCERAKTVCEGTGGSLLGPTLLNVVERPSIDESDCQVTEPWSDSDPTLLIWNSAAGVCEERTYQAAIGDLSFNCQTSPNETQSDFEVINTNYFLYNYPTRIENE